MCYPAQAYRRGARSGGLKVSAKYRQLTESEIKTLVVEDKWLAALSASV